MSCSLKEGKEHESRWQHLQPNVRTDSKIWWDQNPTGATVTTKWGALVLSGIDMSPLLCTNYKFFTVFHRLYSKTQQWFNSLFLSGYQGILEGLEVISIGVPHPEFLMFQPNMLEHVGNDATSTGVCYDHRPRALRTPLPGSRHRLDCVWPVGPHSKLNWARELCTSCTQLAQNVSKILHIWCVQSLYNHCKKVSVLAPPANAYEPTNTIAEIATAAVSSCQHLGAYLGYGMQCRSLSNDVAQLSEVLQSVVCCLGDHPIGCHKSWWKNPMAAGSKGKNMKNTTYPR